MIEKWKESVYSGRGFGALMKDFSKAFDFLHHGLLIAKLEAYGFDVKSVKLIQTKNKGLKGLRVNPLTTNVSIIKNQSVDLLYKSTDWFLYDGNIGRFSVNAYSSWKIFFMVFHRDQTLVRLFSISFCVICFISWKASQ